MTSCIFCKIANGDLPSEKVYEDEHVFAFMDITPVTKGHLLVIPKNHYENVYDLPADEASHLFSVVPKLAQALKETFQQEGMKGLNVLQNNGAEAGQSVFHFHMHLIPRYDKQEDGFQPGWEPQIETLTHDKIAAFAERVRQLTETK
ncbi:HIT domain-containing protein [Planococcaceae bacterium Storch 2/2-2]|nr:HIT domain-containing protein [Planococcaceae bacterium Storch 2/2-2]